MLVPFYEPDKNITRKLLLEDNVRCFGLSNKIIIFLF